MITLELNLNEKELPKLKREFSQLKTVSDKLEFWQLRLKKNYLFYDRYVLQEISPFLIRPTRKSEIYELNHWLLENAILVYGDNTEKIYRSFDKMVIDFEQRLEKVKNKKSLKAHELDSVKKFIEEKSIPQNPLDSRANFFKNGFENFLFHEIEPDYSKKVYEVDNLLALNYGYNLAKYKRYLETIPDKKSIDSEQKFKKLHFRQKLLLLDYIGVLDELGTANTKKAILLSALFGLNSQFIRKELTDFHRNKNPNTTSEKIKLKNDLKTLLEIFSEIDHKKGLKALKTDMHSLDL